MTNSLNSVSNQSNLPQAFIEGKAYDVRELTNYHFLIDRGDLEASTTYPAVLYHNSGERLPVSIRVQKLAGGDQCRFNNISIESTKKLEGWLKTDDDSGDGLNQLSYDDIARGETGDGQKAKSEAPQDNNGGKQKKAGLTSQLAKSAPVFVFLAMILLTVVFFGTIVVVAKKRNRIKVNNGSLVGNYTPVQSSENGRLENCFVNEGDYVESGDILFSVSNAKLDEEFSLAKADMIAAEAKVSAIQQLIVSEEKKFDVAVNQAQQKIQVARAEYTKSISLVTAHRKVVETIQLLKRSRTRYDVSYQKEVSALKALEADVVFKREIVADLELALTSMVDGKFVMFGENLDDRLSRYLADLRFANADVIAAKSKIEVIEQKKDRLNIKSPKSGRIFAVYRSNGEYIKVAEAVLSISSNGRSWAFGAVQLGSAHRIRPGQPVKVSIPALNQEVEGRVASVGHRSIYTSGGWSQDFRVDIHSVPIKVWLPDIPENPPTGLRVKMNVNLPFKWPWQEDEKFDANLIKRTVSVNPTQN